MGVYFIIFGLLALLSFFEAFSLKKIDRQFLFLLVSFLLYLMSFLRWETGNDWSTYLSIFNNSVNWFIDSDLEWGFIRLNEFIKIIFDNYTLLLFCLATILFFFQSKAILRFSPYPVTAVFALWGIFLGNVFFIRQSIATVILFYSIRFIQEKRLIPFLLMVGLAMLFHRTSIIFLLAWPIYRLHIKPVWLWISVAGSILLSIFVSQLLSGLSGLVGGIVQQKLDFYLNETDANIGMDVSMTQLIVRGFANKIFIFAASTILLRKIEKKHPEFRGYLNLYWASIVLYFGTISVSVVLIRLSFAYDFISIILITYILEHIKDKKLKLLVFVVFVLYFLVRMYVTINGSYYDLFVPFKTIFNK